MTRVFKPWEEDYGPERKEWLLRFAGAAGPKQGTSQVRDRFAEHLIVHLAWAILWGARRQHRPTSLPRIANAATAARDAFATLRTEIARTTDGLALHVRSATSVEMMTNLGSLDGVGADAIACYLDRFVALAQAEGERAPRHRGPRNDLAIMIAATIAWTYHDNFGRWPAIGRRGVDPRRSPFDRICEEVEDLLHALGHTQYNARKGKSYRLTLSDPARKKGIQDAKLGEYERWSRSNDQDDLVRRVFMFDQRRVGDLTSGVTNPAALAE
jgi:hypothetical protein